MNPASDPSADRSRSAGLYLKAWRFRPGHLDYLWKAAVSSVIDGLRRKQAKPLALPASVGQELQPNATPEATARIAA